MGPDNRAVRALAAVALVLAAAACHRGASDGASCRQAGARFYELESAQLTQVAMDASAKRRVEHMIAPMRDALVRACTEDKWAAEARACLVAATDRAAYYACESKLTAEQQGRLSAAAAK